MRTVTEQSKVPVTPVCSNTRVNDSGDILKQLGWVSYTCPTTGAKFFAPTIEDAQVKSVEAIRLAQKHNRIITADSKIIPPKKREWRPKHLPKVGAKVNRWTILTESYEKDGKFMIDAECECGTVETKTESRFTGADRSKECTSCSRKRAGRARRSGLLAKLKKQFPINAKACGWTVIGEVYHDGLKYRVPCQCKCGYKKDHLSRRLTEQTLGACYKCSNGKKS